MKVVLPEPAMPMQTIATGSSEPPEAVTGAFEVAMVRDVCGCLKVRLLQCARGRFIAGGGASFACLRYVQPQSTNEQSQVFRYPRVQSGAYRLCSKAVFEIVIME